MKHHIATFLRWLAWKVDGGETDAELRARTLGLIRRRPHPGGREAIERAVTDALPAARVAEFEWIRSGTAESLYVRIR